MENEKKIKFTDVLFIGLAFFATYFGAGNLIFPPMLGLQGGNNIASGVIGMLSSGVLLPILAIWIIGKVGSVSAITDHVHSKFYTVFIGAIMILCCCVSIPRTAAVGIEMGLGGILGDVATKYYIIFVVVYFLIAWFIAKDKGTALNKVGKILTPIMTVILFILAIKSIISPIGTATETPEVEGAFLNSFLGGYSTGDVLVSFLMATVFFSTITNNGYGKHQIGKVNFQAGVVAIICLAVIYGGLYYMGACVSGEIASSETSNAELLLTVVRKSGGQIAIYGLCLSVVLACLTTAIGQITAVSDFYETATGGKLPYKILVCIVPVITTLVATLGLDRIVSLTAPWFSFTYPIALVLMILGIFIKVIPNDGAFKGATWFTVIYAVIDLPHEYGSAIFDGFLNKIPLYGYGFGWVVPAVVGFIIGWAIYAATGKGHEKIDTTEAA